MTDQTWNPKPGDPVKWTAKSSISGRITNVQIRLVDKVTKAGYFSLKGQPGTKFVRGGGSHPNRFVEHVPRKFASVTSRCTFEKPTEAEIATLPRNSMDGSAYAREHQSELAA